MYQRRDSNSQAIKRWFLRPVCLPVSPLWYFSPTCQRTVLSHLTDSNRRPSDYKSEALPTELRGLEDYFFNSLIPVRTESARSFTRCASESIDTESEQVESVQTESEEEVEVSFEQEAKVTNAAINNTFFICFSFVVLVLLAGVEPARTLLPTGF